MTLATENSTENLNPLFFEKRPTAWRVKILCVSHLVFLFALICMLVPTTRTLIRTLDNHTFWLLNHTLVDSTFFQKFWGLLNHRKEVWLNLVYTLSLNAVIIFFAKAEKRLTLFVQFLYFWLVFEIGLYIQDTIILDFLNIQRPSPSLVKHTFVRLSEVFKTHYIVDHSKHSFPSGHAFAMLYWMLFTCFCSPKKIHLLIIFSAVFLCLPRLVSGAHWLTDTLFSGLLAFILFTWAIATPLYPWLLEKSFLKNARKKTK